MECHNRYQSMSARKKHGRIYISGLVSNSYSLAWCFGWEFVWILDTVSAIVLSLNMFWLITHWNNVMLMAENYLIDLNSLRLFCFDISPLLPKIKGSVSCNGAEVLAYHTWTDVRSMYLLCFISHQLLPASMHDLDELFVSACFAHVEYWPSYLIYFCQEIPCQHGSESISREQMRARKHHWREHLLKWTKEHSGIYTHHVNSCYSCVCCFNAAFGNFTALWPCSVKK